MGVTATQSGKLSAVGVSGSWGGWPQGERDMVTMMDSKEAGHVAQTVALVFLGVRRIGSLLDSYFICVSTEVLGQVNKSLTQFIKADSWLSITSQTRASLQIQEAPR